MNFSSDQETVAYLKGLKVGERVIETGNCAFKGRKGTVYHSETSGICVMWDKLSGESGQMGTSVTYGTRRISDIQINFI